MEKNSSEELFDNDKDKKPKKKKLHMRDSLKKDKVKSKIETDEIKNENITAEKRYKEKKISIFTVLVKSNKDKSNDKFKSKNTLQEKNTFDNSTQQNIYTVNMQLHDQFDYTRSLHYQSAFVTDDHTTRAFQALPDNWLAHGYNGGWSKSPSIDIYNTYTGENFSLRDKQNGNNSALATWANSNELLSINDKGGIKLWDIDKARKKYKQDECYVEKNPIRSYKNDSRGDSPPMLKAFSTSDDFFISTADEVITLWNKNKVTRLLNLNGHTSPVNTICAVDNSHIISASQDGMIKYWDIESNQCIKSLANGLVSQKNIFVSSTILPINSVLFGAYGGLFLWDYRIGNNLINVYKSTRCESLSVLNTDQVGTLAPHQPKDSCNSKTSLTIFDINTWRPIVHSVFERENNARNYVVLSNGWVAINFGPRGRGDRGEIIKIYSFGQANPNKIDSKNILKILNNEAQTVTTNTNKAMPNYSLNQNNLNKTLILNNEGNLQNSAIKKSSLEIAESVMSLLKSDQKFITLELDNETTNDVKVCIKKALQACSSILLVLVNEKAANVVSNRQKLAKKIKDELLGDYVNLCNLFDYEATLKILKGTIKSFELSLNNTNITSQSNYLNNSEEHSDNSFSDKSSYSQTKTYHAQYNANNKLENTKNSLAFLFGSKAYTSIVTNHENLLASIRKKVFETERETYNSGSYEENIDNLSLMHERVDNLCEEFIFSYSDEQLLFIGRAYLELERFHHAKDILRVGHKKGRNLDNWYLFEYYILLAESRSDSDVKKKINGFSKAIESKPDNPEAYYYRADTYYRSKEYLKAVDDLNRVIFLSGNNINPKALSLRGMVFIELNDLPSALADFDTALTLYDDFKIYYQRAKLHYELGNYQQALEDYKHAYQLDNENKFDRMEFFYRQGLTNYQLGSYDQAVKDFEQALRSDTKRQKYSNLNQVARDIQNESVCAEYVAYITIRDGIKYHLALIKLARKDYLGAYEDLKKLTQHEFAQVYNVSYASKPELYFHLGLCQYHLGDLKLACTHFERAIQLKSSYAEAYGYAAKCYFDLNNYQKALEYLNKILATPQQQAANSEYLYLRAQCKNKLGDSKGAQADFDTLLSLPKNPNINYTEIYLGRAKAAFNAQQYTKALADYDAVLHKNNNNAEAWYGRGLIYVALKQIPEGIKDLSQALMLNETKDVHVQLGELMLMSDVPEMAIIHFSRAINLDPHGVEVLLKRAEVYLQLKDFKKAEGDYQALIKLQPGNADYHYKLGLMQIEQANFDSADKTLDKASDLASGDISHLIAAAKIKLVEQKVQHKFAKNAKPKVVAETPIAPTYTQYSQPVSLEVPQNNNFNITKEHYTLADKVDGLLAKLDQPGVNIEKLISEFTVLEIEAFDANDVEFYLGRGQVYTKASENNNYSPSKQSLFIKKALADYEQVIQFQPMLEEALAQEMTRLEQRLAQLHKASQRASVALPKTPSFFASSSPSSSVQIGPAPLSIQPQSVAKNNVLVKTEFPYQAIAGLTFQPIQTDGHGLCEAVALYLNQSKEFFRNSVAQHLAKHLGYFQANIKLPANKTLSDYINVVRAGQEWESKLEHEILMQVLQQPIVLLLADYRVVNQEDITRFTRDPIFVFYNGENHYHGFKLHPGYSATMLLKQLQESAAERAVSQNNASPSQQSLRQ